jgi:hypothetical protein
VIEMRGPLLSGAVGSAVTLRRLSEILRAQGPTVVVRSPWLGLTLATELTVLALVPREAQAAARRRARRKSATQPPALFALSGAVLPLADGVAGSLVVADLAEIEPAALVGYLLETAALIRPGGVLVGLDRTKEAATEARIAGALLTAGFVGIAQERPREGALLSQGCPPPAVVRAALLEVVPRPAATSPAPSEPAPGTAAPDAATAGR